MARTWAQILSALRARNPDVTPIPDANVTAAERLLGTRLPPGYRRLVTQLGAIHAPVSVHTPEHIVADAQHGVRPAGCPDTLLFFASDGGEILSAFDTRRAFRGEYAIVDVDLEERHDDDGVARSAGGGVKAWLEQVLSAAEEDDASVAARDAEDRLDALMRPEVGLGGRWCPSREEITEVEARLGVSLPDDYVQLALRFGSVDWPLELVDPTSLEELRATLARRGVAVPLGLLPVGRDAARTILLDRAGRVVELTSDGPPRHGRERLLDWLEREVKAARLASRAPGTAARTGAPDAAVSRFDRPAPGRVAQTSRFDDSRLRVIATLARDAQRMHATAAAPDWWNVTVPYQGATVTKLLTSAELASIEGLTGIVATRD